MPAARGKFPTTAGAWPRRAALVKIVALSPHQSILREQLVDQLWPELDPDAGANNLHQALHVARRTLGGLLPDVKPNRASPVTARCAQASTPPVPVWVDVDAFEQQARDLRTADDPAGFYPTLDLYRGDLLPDDLYEDWASERRIVLHESYLGLLDRLAGLHRARREATQAIDALRRIRRHRTRPRGGPSRPDGTVCLDRSPAASDPPI